MGSCDCYCGLLTVACDTIEAKLVIDCCLCGYCHLIASVVQAANFLCHLHMLCGHTSKSVNLSIRGMVLVHMSIY